MSAVEERERVCINNSACLLRLHYPCFNKFACASNCTGTCTGTWKLTKSTLCNATCAGATREVEYICIERG